MTQTGANSNSVDEDDPPADTWEERDDSPDVLHPHFGTTPTDAIFSTSVGDTEGVAALLGENA